jgi:hypothetical protein
MILWSAMPFAIVGISIRESCRFFENEWLLLIPIVAAAMGCVLVYVAIRTDDATFEKRLDLLTDAGQWAGILILLVAFVVAVPIYEIQRYVRSKYDEP